MFCENCGKQLIEGSRFCGVCGYPVAAQPAPEQPVYAQPAPEQPVYAQPAPEQPVYAQPAPEQPVYAQPAPEQPVYAQPAPEQPASGNKKKAPIIVAIVCGCIVALIALFFGAVFAAGNYMYNSGDYETARICYEILGSDERITACDYAEATALAEAGDYEAAWRMFDSIADYEDSAICAAQARVSRAQELFEDGKYREAYDLCVQAEDNADCAELMMECMMQEAIDLYEQGEYSSAADIFYEYIGSHELAEMYADLCAFRTAEEVGYISYEASMMFYDSIIGYAEHEEAARALESPMLFIARLFGAEYKRNSYALECVVETMTIKHYVPWGTPGGSIWTFFDEDAFYFFVDDDFWFAITGFDSYDTLHPDEMYVVGANEQEYVFTLKA